MIIRLRPERCLVVVLGVLSLWSGQSLCSAERTVDPTFLHRYLPDISKSSVDPSTPTCHYRPLFGLGDSQSRIVKGIARYGEITIDPGGKGSPTTCPKEEQVCVVLEGACLLSYNDEDVPLKKNDFAYLPPGVRRQFSNPNAQSCRLIVMGFKIPADVKPVLPPNLLMANIDDVKKQTVGNHPPSVLYQLLVGDTNSTRDRIAASHVLTSLFIMEFAPGGTNFPHHHEREEEIYLVLEGQGDMVAGGGVTGIEGRHPAKAGDAYFFRLNCTVGFYSTTEPGTRTRVLAVRSLFPFRNR